MSNKKVEYKQLSELENIMVFTSKIGVLETCNTTMFFIDVEIRFPYRQEFHLISKNRFEGLKQELFLDINQLGFFSMN